MTENFKFIRDDVFLCPWVDTITGKQKLILKKINLETNEVEFEDSIDCIHTAITDISVEEYYEYMNNDDFQEDLIEKSLEIRSSEGLKEIKLNPKEKFQALKSWAIGIAEAGRDAFRIQSEIDTSANLAYPMAGFLIRFMTQVDSNFTFEYLSKIEKESVYEGEQHGPYMLANLIPIMGSLMGDFKSGELKKSERKIISAIIDMDPPLELFTKNLENLAISTLVTSRFLHIYLNKIEEKSIIDGIRNNEVLVERLKPLFDFIKNRYVGEEKNSGVNKSRKTIFSAIFDMDPPIELITQNFETFLKFPEVEDFTEGYIEKIENECVYEGMMHKSSYIANIVPIIYALRSIQIKNEKLSEHEKNILLFILERDFTFNILESKNHLPILLAELKSPIIKKYFNYLLNEELQKKISNDQASFNVFTQLLTNLWSRYSISSYWYGIPDEKYLSLLMDMNPPFEVFEKKPVLLELVAYLSHDRIADLFKKIDKKSRIDGIRDEKLLIKFLRPIYHVSEIKSLITDRNNLKEKNNMIKSLIFNLN